MRNLTTAIVGAVLAAMTATPASAQNFTAANKAGVAADTLVVVDCTDVTFVAGCTLVAPVVVLGPVTFKMSDPKDLQITVSLECALWTSTKTSGNQTSTAEASVLVTVKIDGIAVLVSPADGVGPGGAVVFCDRTQTLTTTNFDDVDATIEMFLRDRHANAFTWVAQGPVGSLASNVHVLTVEVALASSVSGTGVGKAAAGVGKRTAVFEPIQLTNGVVF